jgi:hypothetical protein
MENGGSRSSTTPMIIGIVGGLALAIGSFLNWATVSVNFDKIATALGIDPAQIPAGVRAQGTVSVTGWKSGDGKWTLVAGVVVAVAAALLAMASSRQVVGIVMLVGGAVGGGLALYDATIQKNNAIDNAAAQFSNIGLPGTIRDYFSVSLGIGIWLCIVGGVVAIVGGIMAIASRAPSISSTTDLPMGSAPPAPPVSDGGFVAGVGGSLMAPVEAAPVVEPPPVEPPPVEPPPVEPPPVEPPVVEPPVVEPPVVEPPVVEPPVVEPPVAPDVSPGTGVPTPEEDPPGTS